MTVKYFEFIWSLDLKNMVVREQQCQNYFENVQVSNYAFEGQYSYLNISKCLQTCRLCKI